MSLQLAFAQSHSLPASVLAGAMLCLAGIVSSIARGAGLVPAMAGGGVPPSSGFKRADFGGDGEGPQHFHSLLLLAGAAVMMAVASILQPAPVQAATPYVTTSTSHRADAIVFGHVQLSTKERRMLAQDLQQMNFKWALGLHVFGAA